MGLPCLLPSGSRWRFVIKTGGPIRIRTENLEVKKLSLYQIELWARNDFRVCVTILADNHNMFSFSFRVIQHGKSLLDLPEDFFG